jgi:hypothetical protein
MERNSFWYLKQFLDAIDNDDLTYEEKAKATYTLCYYGIKGVFPPEAGGYEKMYAKSNEKLFEGQDNFRSGASKNGTKGGSNVELTDEEIRKAYAALYFELGKHPTEQQVIKKTGANVQRIARRKVWGEDKNQWIEMYRDLYSIQKDIQKECIYTGGIQKDIQNGYTYTYTDF